MKKLINNILMDSLIAFYAVALVGAVAYLPTYMKSIKEEMNGITADNQEAIPMEEENPDSDEVNEKSDAYFSGKSNDKVE